MKVIIFILLIISQGYSQSEINPPNGYRKITIDDYKNEFEENLKLNPLPYHTTEDYDGNGIKDEVWLFAFKDNKGWGLFTYLKYEDNKVEMIKLESDTNETIFQKYYVSSVESGTYQTAHGKGYGNFNENTPTEITLNLPAINFGIFEGTNSFFYWVKDSRKFKKVWISD